MAIYLWSAKQKVSGLNATVDGTKNKSPKCGHLAIVDKAAIRGKRRPGGIDTGMARIGDSYHKLRTLPKGRFNR